MKTNKIKKYFCEYQEDKLNKYEFFAAALQNNVLHFVKDGSAKLMFSYKRNLYYTPIMLILKCLVDVSDEYIVHQFMTGYEDDTYMKG
jgi:hypothetical protein